MDLAERGRQGRLELVMPGSWQQLVLVVLADERTMRSEQLVERQIITELPAPHGRPTLPSLEVLLPEPMDQQVAVGGAVLLLLGSLLVPQTMEQVGAGAEALASQGGWLLAVYWLSATTQHL